MSEQTRAKAACVLGVLVAFAACAAGDRTSAAPPANPAGTYAVQLCEGTCDASDPGRVVLEGRITLHDRLLDVARVSSQGQFFLATENDPNACWVADDSPRAAEALTWNAPVGGSIWRLDSTTNELRFRLGTDIHSHYEVVARLRGDSIIGRGRLFEAMNSPQWAPPQVVRGKRIGAPDPSPCYLAADSLAIEMQRQARIFEAGWLEAHPPD